MLGRYQLKRGAPAEDLPRGVRQDTCKHTRHVLRPPAEIVSAYLASPTEEAWTEFAAAYRAALDRRFATERARFDELAELARTDDVWLGCSCPTRKSPSAQRCHTWVALEYMKERYPDLEVRFPAAEE